MCNLLFIKDAYNAFGLSCLIQNLINGCWFVRLSLCGEIKLLPVGHHFNSGTVVFVQPPALLSCKTHAWNMNHHPLYLYPIYISKDFYPTERKSAFVVVKVLAQFHKYAEHHKWLPSQWWSKLLQHLWVIPWVIGAGLPLLSSPGDPYIQGFFNAVPLISVVQRNHSMTDKTGGVYYPMAVSHSSSLPTKITPISPFCLL